MTPPNPAIPQLTNYSIMFMPIEIGSEWRLALFYGLSICLAVILRHHLKRIGWAAFFLWAYYLYRALWLFEYPSWPFLEFNNAFMATAGQSFAEALLIPLTVLMLTDSQVDRAIRWFKFVVLFELGSAWFGYHGLMHMASFGDALAALYLPFAPLWLMALIVVTVLTHHGSTAMTILLAEAIALSTVLKSLRIGLLLLIPGVYGVARLHQNGAYLDSLERINKYKKYMGFWAGSNRFMAFGVGPGSFMWCGLLIDKLTPPFFLQMHSDWLQIAFELGLVGIALVVNFLLRTLKKVKGDTRLLAAVLGTVPFAMTYMPLRWFPSMALITLIFRKTLCQKEEKSGPG